MQLHWRALNTNGIGLVNTLRTKQDIALCLNPILEIPHVLFFMKSNCRRSYNMVLKGEFKPSFCSSWKSPRNLLFPSSLHLGLNLYWGLSQLVWRKICGKSQARWDIHTPLKSSLVHRMLSLVMLFRRSLYSLLLQTEAKHLRDAKIGYSSIS